MIGMDRNTGKALGGIDHLRQSVRDILTSPLFSRVMRRDYGSDLDNLVDKPANVSTLTDIYAAVAGAIKQWEPRIRLTKVSLNTDLSSAASGSLYIDLSGVYVPNGQLVTIPGIQIK